MNLVLFLDACKYIARLSRAIHHDQGNCLLLGSGGNGRHSLGRLATYITGFRLFEVGDSKNYNLK